MTTAAGKLRIPLSVGDIIKRVFLGKPLITEDIASEKLSNPVALGALSPDAVSSVAYGPEQILIELLPHAGLAAFVLLLPITGVILFILALVAASYRQVVMAYTRAGGSYIVARDNFGPRVAQIAAAALLIDYVVTVAVQSAAGTVAVVSAIPALGPYSLETHGRCGAAHLLCEPARAEGSGPAVRDRDLLVRRHARPDDRGRRCPRNRLGTYRSTIPRTCAGAVPVHQGNGLVMGATILVVLRAFANGGSSLTGVEAISNTVNVFRKPQGRQRAPRAHRHGLHSGVPAGRCRLSGPRHPRHAVSHRISVGAFANCPCGLRQRRDRRRLLRPGPGSDRRHLVHRCQHQFQRFSGAGQFRRRGPLPAAPAHQTRSPAGVLERHHHARRHCRWRCWW